MIDQSSPRVLLLQCASACIIGLFLAGEAKAQTPPGAPPVPVTFDRVRVGPFPIMIDALGQVQATNTVQIRSRVDGEIEAILFNEGQTVAKDDLLVRIDQRPYKAALGQVVAKLAQDQATLDNARVDLKRYADLAQKTYGTVQQYDTQKAAVASGEALIQADQAAIESARVQLSYTEIRSPIAGRVGFRMLDAGNIVHAADTAAILSITQMTPITVVLSVPESRVGEVNESVEAGQALVSLTSNDGSKRLGNGTLKVVNNLVDVTSGTMPVKATFDNTARLLWPGQTVMAHVHVSDRKNAKTIPNTAIQRGVDGLYAWVIDAAGVASIKKINVVAETGSISAVDGDLSAGDRIITDGQYRLAPGSQTDAIESKPLDQGKAK